MNLKDITISAAHTTNVSATAPSGWWRYYRPM